MSSDKETVKQSLDKIFNFLKENKNWNANYQTQEYNWNLAHLETPRQRLLSLLHIAVNSQGFPRMGDIAKFWRALHEKLPDEKITPLTFTEILEQITAIPKMEYEPWNRMFHALRVQSGWGKKAAALFIKSSLQVNKMGQKECFWKNDTIEFLSSADRIYLPVDTVIQYIFANLGLLKRVDFESINDLLHLHYCTHDMFIWDDLWFWGFFTQKKENKKRISVWNSEKFWCQRASPIQKEAEVRSLAEQFLKIIDEIAAQADGGKP
jgi:hypothetical protein